MRRRNARAWWGGALVAVLTAGAVAGEPAVTDPPRVVALQASPAAVELDNRYAYVQLVLTAALEDGSRVDVTREAELVAGSELIELSERRFLRPRADGEGELVFALRGVRVTVPVRVRDQGVAARPSFVRDVMPVLSRRGCNTGTCHGADKGQNGFKLSLRGYDPDFDHRSLTDDLAGRRFDRVAPAQSLFLLKPSGAVAHEGGRRLAPGHPDYALLEAWVEGGVAFDVGAARVTGIEVYPDTPILADAGSTQQFRVVATYADGARRDVTDHTFFETSDREVSGVDEGGLATAVRRGETAIMARYEGQYAVARLFVMGDRAGFAWEEQPEHNYIDSLVYARLREIAALPSGLCDDAEFLRRVHLDLTGVPPTRKEVTTFLMDRRDTATKRDEVIDRLIGSAAFVEHWTNRWADLLQVNRKFLGEKGAGALREWIRGAIASNMPYDEFVRQLLTTSGSTLKNPPAAYYKVLRKPDLIMENTTQLFLGIRFNCNKCHDHPFERWTKDQHWQLSGYFAQVDRKDAPGSKKMPRSKVMESGEKAPAYEELIGDRADGEAVDEEGLTYEAAFPYEHDGAVRGDQARRVQFADWLVDADNHYFVRSYVNRLWSYFLGIGLIDPVDDIRASNPPTFPHLLDRLAADFVEGDFDVRRMMRRICRSRVYQHSLATNPWNADDRTHYAHAVARRLPAEVLFDAIHQATGSMPRLPGTRARTRAAELVDSSVKGPDGFLDMFGRPPRESSCECERKSGMSLRQALNLVNGQTLAEAIADPHNLIHELVEHEDDPAEIIRDLYLGFLCRPPTDAELGELVGMFDARDIANKSALGPEDQAELERRIAAWEAELPKVVWHTIEPGNMWSEGGAELTVLDDRSILVAGEKPPKDSYVISGTTDVAGITGIRLEVLPHESLPGKGPGRAENGNFVLAHLDVTALPLTNPAAVGPVKFSKATASFSQKSWPVAQSIVDSDKGWGVSPKLGRRQVAVFETAADLGSSDGTLLILCMKHPYGEAHTLGRFRWSVTSAPRPVRHSRVPDEILAIVAVPAASRTDAQRAALHRHYLGTDPEMAGRIRLGAAQDLAWALASSSAFLFNR